MKKLVLLGMALCLLMGAVSGCATALVAAGAAGAYTYLEGELKRTYQVPFSRAVQVSTDVAEELRITITGRNDQGTKYVINGTQPDNTPVTINVTNLGPDASDIGVRVGLTGVWDRQAAETIQNYIARDI